MTQTIRILQYVKILFCVLKNLLPDVLNIPFIIPLIAFLKWNDTDTM